MLARRATSETGMSEFFIRFDSLIDVDGVCPDDSGQYFSQRE